MGSAAAYLGGADAKEPAASPLFGDLGDLPPLLVTVDESEILLDDSTRLVEGLRAAGGGRRAAGGEAELIRRTGPVHVWPVLVPWMREAREDVDAIVAFLRARLAGVPAAGD